MDTLFLKKVDSAVGSLLTHLCPTPTKSNITLTRLRRLLLIRPGGIGDAVLLVPAIRAFKTKFPDCEVTVLAERRNGSVFALCPDVAQVLLYDHPRQLVKAICRHFDVVVDTEQCHRLSAVVARLIRSDLKIGFATNDRKRLFHFAQPYDHENYEVDSFLSLLEPLGVETGNVEVPYLRVPDQCDEVVGELLAPLADRPYVALFPGASIPERRWGSENFHLLAVWLNGQGMSVVVVGGRQDLVAGENILNGCQGINLSGRTSLAETAAVLRRSRLLVSGDSGVLHLAVGLDVPTLSLFGPGIVKKWAPRGRKHIVVSRHCECSPCTRFGTTPPCPYDVRCMRAITVEDVIEGLEQVLVQAEG